MDRGFQISREQPATQGVLYIKCKYWPCRQNISKVLTALPRTIKACVIKKTPCNIVGVSMRLLNEDKRNVSNALLWISHSSAAHIFLPSTLCSILWWKYLVLPGGEWYVTTSYSSALGDWLLYCHMRPGWKSSVLCKLQLEKLGLPFLPFSGWTEVGVGVEESLVGVSGKEDIKAKLLP